MKWAARLPIGHALPTPKASIFSSIFRRHKQSCLSVPRLIRRPKRYPTVDCGMVDFLTGIAGPIRAAYRDSARMCLSLDGPALPLVLPRDLLLMRRFSRLPGRRWKSGHPGCRQNGDSRRNRSDRPKSRPPHVCCGRQGHQRRRGRSRRSGRDRNSLSFNFIRLATHLLLQRSIGGLAIGVPLCSHCIGDFHSHSGVRICITGHEEGGCLLGAEINMILPPFRHVEIAGFQLKENVVALSMSPWERETIEVKRQ